MEDELKRLNDEKQYMRSAFNILRKNVIIREEKPQMEIKPPDILKDDKELIDLTQSVAVVSHKFYSLEKELDNVYRKISQLTTTIAGTERNNDTESSKKINVEATARKPRNIPAQVTALSPQCLKLEKDFELITSAWRGMKEKERSHTTSLVGEQSKSTGADGGDVESLNDIKELKDKSFVQKIIMDVLDEYVTAEGKSDTFDIPSQLQSDQRFNKEREQAKRIAGEFKKMARVLTAVENEKGKMKQEYETKFINLNDEYEKLKTAHQTLEEKLNNAYLDLTKAEEEKANMKKDLDEFLIDNENLKTTNTDLEESLRSGSACVK